MPMREPEGESYTSISKLADRQQSQDCIEEDTVLFFYAQPHADEICRQGGAWGAQRVGKDKSSLPIKKNLRHTNFWCIVIHDWFSKNLFGERRWQNI